MQLTPRYGDDPVLTFEVPLGDPAVPAVRQRRRLARTLAGLDEEAWLTPSRCEGWAVRDVVAHLVGTNAFWAHSVAAGLAGEPTRLLTGFDPVATPAAMVGALADRSPAELLAQFDESNEALARVVGGLDAASWSAPAEAPPGHLSVAAVVLHALWDGWVHERDIVLPLDLPPVLEDAEVTGCLRYAAALGPAYAAVSGSTRTGTLGVEATDIVPPFVVDLGPEVVVRPGPVPAGVPVLTGGAAALIEALSQRGSPIELPSADCWMVEGLAVAFDAGT